MRVIKTQKSQPCTLQTTVELSLYNAVKVNLKRYFALLFIISPLLSSSVSQAEKEPIVELGEVKSLYDPSYHEGCQKRCSEKSINYKEGDIVANGNAKIGQITKCPTSRVIFRIRKSTPKIMHKGKQYQFCCIGCFARFKTKTKAS